MVAPCPPVDPLTTGGVDDLARAHILLIGNYGECRARLDAVRTWATRKE